MISILAASHYFQPIGDGDALPPLDGVLNNLAREPLRRVDRFIELAILGSARCAAGQALHTDCGIYLGSGLGPMGSNISVQEQLVRNREIPRPFDFINTLGGSAGYYIAKNLDLNAQNLFITRRGASMEATLSAALADMALGLSAQALVGVVEEVTLPLAAHRHRRDLTADAPVAEGSHWLLLQAGANSPGSLTAKRFAGFAELVNGLESVWRPGDQLRCATQLPRSAMAALQRQFVDASTPDPNGPSHDSLQAAWVTEFVTARAAGNLYLVGGYPDQGWTLFHFCA